jgi:hypothetical protein
VENRRRIDSHCCVPVSLSRNDFPTDHLTLAGRQIPCSLTIYRVSLEIQVDPLTLLEFTPDPGTQTSNCLVVA